ncbi:hypothetical protein K2173_026755 [Erythroxylum novogranatense]|uniref:CCT domain-containing protein n=1 Tax=Erythroxylum novogranatense TaxID=1862640 RepID=A0AAV8TZM2_9ROSI|nr:hypothetical protein K2173_026755 [Erythroxylum novogranatense]
MYAETGLLFPYVQNFSQDIHQLEEYCKYQKITASLASSIVEYDLGVEGDLFKAPEPIIEETVVALDPMAAAISMMSCGEEVIGPAGLKVSDIESIQSEQLLSDVFYECKKDLIEKVATGAPLSEVLDIKIPIVRNDENETLETKVLPALPLPKSVSSGCLSSMEWMNAAAMKASCLDFSRVEFETANGMRRAFSEGDIKTLCNGNISHIQSRPLIIGNCTSEDRMEKLSRYRNKKTKRNFGRKIKYACRKALADSQPRIRGRFAKNEEPDMSKRE